MTRIFLYGVEATYGSGCDFEWPAPPLGGRHKLILFLAQTNESAQDDRVVSELARFGFVDLHVGIGRPIEVEALNDPRMQVFRRHYEGALAEGVSIVWYP